jgi:oligopeptide transport system substrate-binding protein
VNRTLALALAALLCGCGAGASRSEYFGKVVPPQGQVLRYISGAEPESLDPQKSTGQPEIRIHMALFEGLVEYHPKSMQPIPAVAERWALNTDASELVFFLRRNARFSNGDPINAHDFVYTIRRGLDPATAARGAQMAYEIKYAKALNSNSAFVRDPATGRFVAAAEAEPDSSEAAPPGAEAVMDDSERAAPDTEFHRFMHEPARLTVPFEEKARAKALAASPRLKALVEGKELVRVAKEDVGVEAVDDYTLRITLAHPAPYFLGVLPAPFFRAVPRKVIERHGAAWARPGNLVGGGPFRLASHRPYSEIVVEKNPEYWDAGSVRLERIHFYPMDQQTATLNLYKAGEVDAVYNHTVPTAWLKSGLREMKDYMHAPENANEYYLVNTTRPPMDNVRVRRAFSLALDRRAFAEFKVVAKPLWSFVPEGIFPGYPQAAASDFDPARARQLLAEAGYKDAAGNYDPKKFPAEEVEINYNTGEAQQANAEFAQAQWKQHLGLTLRIKAFETRTFSEVRSKLQYRGFARQGWGGDYMDPFTFLGLFTVGSSNNGTGWTDAAYDSMLERANREPDHAKRYELLARAEAHMLDAQPVVPLLTPATNWMKKPYVKGLYPNPGTYHAWKFVYIEHDRTRWDSGVPDMTGEQAGD